MKFLAVPLLLFATISWATTCDSGNRQSPIDITTTTRQNLPVLKFDYHAVPLKIANDDHTARVRFDTGNLLYIGSQRYTLQQIHFHTPGSDRIAGEAFPMAAHLLHKSQSGQLLVVEVLFRIGAENPLLDFLLPLIPAHADGDHMQEGTTIDASRLLPQSRGYYRYQGSLTSPPCTEGVDWIVLKQPLELSAAQLARYHELFSDNGRAVQPLNRRTVLESF